uniref:Cardioactive peptide n=1 Tax=Strigamia maritima TaxID=126957 RepID=T1J0Y2_STRMM
MQYVTIHGFVTLLLIVFSCTIGCAAQKRRPFCNAFTGCGRKRSELPASNVNDLETDLLLDKLSHQILGLVHVLEALHMRIETSRQNQQPLPMIETDSRIPNYILDRKRRSTKI